MSYNQGWMNHPNISWKNNQVAQQPFPQSQQQFPPPQPQSHQPTHMKQLEVQPDVLNQFMTETGASIRSLETQMGLLDTLMTNRAQGNLPSTTLVNPKEQCNAISLRSGKELKEPKVVDKEKELSESNITENLEKQPKISIDHHIKIPYPQRLRKTKLNKHFSKFLDIFRKIHINIPFTEALEQMPIETKALCDLGASVNLMHLSIFRMLNLGEARPTTMSLQMADTSVKHPHGVIENVLVKVDKFIFPADFFILDMEDD
ncbi:uncharacterized protein LOC133792239 [Humulus lupulus]|uniref:uncharacterized protein LOC133792239 n=1 Tax=Humulus lupulus TaxID=3486 RepID=UPI002B40C2BF|nr:uncharacterized protein LOC133792239 [Humulus lupulus]